MQPLDVGVFLSLKSQYRKFFKDFSYEDVSVAASKKSFLFCYHKARSQALN
jgi:hypothetical protein